MRTQNKSFGNNKSSPETKPAPNCNDPMVNAIDRRALIVSQEDYDVCLNAGWALIEDRLIVGVNYHDIGSALSVVDDKASYFNGPLTVGVPAMAQNPGTTEQTMLTVHGIVSASSFQVNGAEIGGGKWSDASGDMAIHYSGGSVGIGTKAPEAALDVRGAISFREENETQGFFPLGGLDQNLRFIVGTRRRTGPIGEGFDLRPSTEASTGVYELTLQQGLNYKILHVICSVIDDENIDSLLPVRAEIVGDHQVIFRAGILKAGSEVTPHNTEFSFLIIMK